MRDCRRKAWHGRRPDQRCIHRCVQVRMRRRPSSATRPDSCAWSRGRRVPGPGGQMVIDVEESQNMVVGEDGVMVPARKYGVRRKRKSVSTSAGRRTSTVSKTLGSRCTRQPPSFPGARAYREARRATGAKRQFAVAGHRSARSTPSMTARRRRATASDRCALLFLGTRAKVVVERYAGLHDSEWREWEYRELKDRRSC